MPVSRNRRRLRNVVAVLAAGVVSAALLPASAQAHAFLIRSDPPAGARLRSAPSQLVMHFSEAYVRGSEHVSLRTAAGKQVTLPKASGTGAVVRQPLPANLRGVFIVSWTLLSDDGHLCAGDFAFSVGTGGALPAVSASSTPTPWSQAVASWLLFAGLAIAFGGILSELLVWRRSRARAFAVAGVTVAAGAAVALLVLLAGARVNGGFAAGLAGGALRAVLTSRPGALTLAVIGALLAAALLAAVGRTRALALVPLAAAAVLISVRGHAGTSGHWWAPVVDSIHLLAAAAWVGALVHLALVVVRAPDRTAAGAFAVRRYARLALPTVLIVLASGVLTAFAEFRSVGSAFHTSYGRTLIVKAALVLVVLAIASASRFLALPANPGVRFRLLRRLSLSEAVLVVAVLAAVGLLVNLAPPRTSAAAVPAGSALGPPPLSGPAVRLSGFAGRTAVGLVATRRELQFDVMPPPGKRASTYKLTAEAERPSGASVVLYPRPCGAGCFSILFPSRSGTTRVTVTVSTPGAPSAETRFDVPAPIPAARPALLRRVVKALRTAPSVHVAERLTDGVRSLSSPTAYLLTGRGFVGSEAFAVGGATDVRVVGRARGLTELTFASRDATSWYRAWIDGRFRLRREQIVAAGLLVSRTLAYPQAGTEVVVRPGPVPQRSIPIGPFVAAKEDGDLAVGFAAEPARPGRLRLTTTVIGPDGEGATGLRVAVRLRSGTNERGPAAPCASGCYAVTLPFTGAPRTALITIRRLGHVPTTVSIDFPSSWPPPSAEQIAREATRVFSALRSLKIDEHLGSSATNIRHTLWQLRAPNRLTYAIEDGPDAVIIGDRRWDRDPGGQWVESSQVPVKQPTPAWVSAPRQATLLGSGSFEGRAVWRISFAEPDVPAWFTVSLDKQTLRALELWMIAPAHFMHHLYSGFDEPMTIRPPRAASANG